MCTRASYELIIYVHIVRIYLYYDDDDSPETSARASGVCCY